MAAPLIVIGLDSCDAGTVRRLAGLGQLPNMARFLEDGARATIRSPSGLFVGAIWVDFQTGVDASRHGFYSWEAIDVPSYQYHLVEPVISAPPFWDALSEAGRRVAMVDVPHSRVHPLNGVIVTEWGCHDRHFGLQSHPPDKAQEIVSTFGFHPILGIDPFVGQDFAADDVVFRKRGYRTPAEEAGLLEGLVRGVAAKRRILSDVMAEEPWDLFVGVFGESHAAGHQQWHLHDHAHPRFDAKVRDTVGQDPIVAVYQALDTAVGELLEATDPDATVLLVLSHGMTAHHDGAHLLEEALKRLDQYYDAGFLPMDTGNLARRASQRLGHIINRLPTVRRAPLLVRRIVARLTAARGYIQPPARARQRFFREPNNTVYGGIRFNLIGREPEGSVTPQEADELAEQLERDLMELVNVETGEPVVRRVWRSDAHYARSPQDLIPDLFVEWNRSASIETVHSPKIGTVHAPYLGWRTGDHLGVGMLLARGPGIPPGTRMPPVDMVDLPATISHRLGVPLDGSSGTIIPWLAEPALQPA